MTVETRSTNTARRCALLSGLKTHERVRGDISYAVYVKICSQRLFSDSVCVCPVAVLCERVSECVSCRLYDIARLYRVSSIHIYSYMADGSYLYGLLFIWQTSPPSDDAETVVLRRMCLQPAILVSEKNSDGDTRCAIGTPYTVIRWAAGTTRVCEAVCAEAKTACGTNAFSRQGHASREESCKPGIELCVSSASMPLLCG